MYHKLGPRPSGTRLKGLYVSERLFRKQLQELRRADFSTPEYDGVVDSPANSSRIILTFDDGFENVLRYGLEPLRENGFRAIQFLVADKLGKTNDWETCEGEAEEPLMNFSQINEWIAAGNEIGSHTLTHPKLTQISRDQAREEIVASKKRLEDAFGFPIRHFCYPYGDFNNSIEEIVKEAGYATACTTNPGMNGASTEPYRLKRLMARHATRKWSQIRQRWALRLRQIFSKDR